MPIVGSMSVSTWRIILLVVIGVALILSMLQAAASSTRPDALSLSGRAALR